MFAENHDFLIFFHTPLHLASQLGGTHGNTVILFGTEKLE